MNGKNKITAIFRNLLSLECFLQNPKRWFMICIEINTVATHAFPCKFRELRGQRV